MSYLWDNCPKQVDTFRLGLICMVNTDEYIEPDKNRRKLIYVAIPVVIIFMVLLDWFLGKETENYLQSLDALSVEQMEQEAKKAINQLFAVAAVVTVVWLVLSVFVLRQALAVWRTEQFPVSGTRTAFRTRIRKGVAAKRWSVLLLSLIPLSAIVFLGLPYYVLWALHY